MRRIKRPVREWVPSLRECIGARPRKILSSVDFDSGELITHAQSCIWITGHSMLGEALKSGIKVHHALGASMVGVRYDEFLRRFKSESLLQYARQAAKPGNFGFPGGMGPVKLVHQQRTQGPDTVHASGPSQVEDENGDLVPGYKGLRFCIYMDGAPRCGERKVIEWRGRRISPTCLRCIECAVRLKKLWLQQWPENTPYFEYINECCESGMLVTAATLDRWPHLRPFFRAGMRLEPGQIMQHVSGRVRQVNTSETESPYCSAANGFFQGLLGDASKAAVRRISRECYDRTVRVSDMAHENSPRSRYAGSASPLYGSRLISFQHDEVLTEHPEDQAHDGATRVSEIMIEELRHYCPDLAPAVGAAPALMRRWFKSAAPRWARGGDRGPADGNDTLIPWEPESRMAA